MMRLQLVQTAQLVQAFSLEERYCCVLHRVERLVESGQYVRGLKMLYHAAEEASEPYGLELRSKGDSLFYAFGDGETRRAIRDYYTDKGKKLVETHSTSEIDLLDAALILQIFDQFRVMGYWMTASRVAPYLKTIPQRLNPAGMANTPSNQDLAETTKPGE